MLTGAAIISSKHNNFNFIKKENLPEVNEEETEDKDGKENEDGSSDINKQKDTEARRRSLAAEKILREASELGDSIEAMTRLIKASDTLVRNHRSFTPASAKSKISYIFPKLHTG